MTALDSRPRVGRLVVPFMVDEKRTPIDFRMLDHERVAACAQRRLCGVCGGKIKRGPIAFLGPDDGRTCFADPWMHPACAEVALAQCPFLSGRRDWRSLAGEDAGVLAVAERVYRPGQMVMKLAHNWRAHSEAGNWHFEAVA